MDPRLFFPAGPPPFAPFGGDPMGQKIPNSFIIHKTIDFAVRNGPAFIDEVRIKQAHNPDYAFLRGGEGSAYFSWALFCSLTGHPPSHPLPTPPGTALASPLPTASQQYSAAASLPEEVSSGWSQVLSLLNSTRESITSSQAWFMACAPYAAGMAELTAHRCSMATDFDTQLHIIYLVNDILFKGQSQRPPGGSAASDSIAAAFRPLLGGILHRAYAFAGTDSGKQEKLVKVVNIWSERGVYPAPEVEMMVMEMMGVVPQTVPQVVPHTVPLLQQSGGQGDAGAAAGAPWMAHRPAMPAAQHMPHPMAPPPPPPPQQQQYHPHPPPPHDYQNHGHTPMRTHHHHPGSAPPPRPPVGHFPPAGQLPPHHPHHVYQHTPTAPPRPPEEPPFDPMSFPPGLIPKLVEEKLQVDREYSPLVPRDIEQCPVPPPPQMDDYLKARMDKFYAQLADYRPGMSFCDIEGDPPRQRHFSDRAPGEGLGPGHPTGQPLDDGSGGFRGRGGARGLGYGTDGGAEDDDVFASYRRMRSTGYHGGIIRTSAGKGGRKK